MTDSAEFTLADGGIETALVERLGQHLPEFAAFVLLASEEGREALRAYYRPFVDIAREQGRSLVLDTPTWRANADWGARLGYDADALAAANREAVELVRELVEREVDDFPVAVNGCVGPRFDEEARMSPEESEAYHRPQIAALAAAGADRVTAVTATGADEAIGIVRAAGGEGIPVAVSFGLGPNGALLDGRSLAEGIATVDAATSGAAEMFMVNCAHPIEVGAGMADEAELARIVGLRLNAARHGDDGQGDAPETFAAAVWALCERLPAVRILGGCCGTDAPHIEAIARLVR
ncbi:homocysteine S-methyltransferase family protein [Leucobacter tardus]|uniref:Homocysteine S-methyltransferase family protein n=1 Tax=Leucobacter tardus TaxID=501483 RepID=A0A939QJ16_9MICO|nr:homocysteine S-methyltransferase family protein [Leucobacter tardus]MBO2990938.1 homocysteine S-methyltransferase family protein [Leucobacter tardus]